MSQFLHQIFYANNKFEITEDTYTELRKWAIPKNELICFDGVDTGNTDRPLLCAAPAESGCAHIPTQVANIDTGEFSGETAREFYKKPEPVTAVRAKPNAQRIPANLSIFKSIFILHYGYPEYLMLGSRITNREIDEKHKMMEVLSKTPKKMKEGNHRLTHDNIQEIVSGLLVSSKEEIMQMVAYSAYYGKIIYLVFQHSYLVFAPTKDATVTESAIANGEVYVLNQTRKHPRYGGSYYPDLDLTLEKIQKIHETKVHLEHYAKPFRGISAYKMSDLEDIAYKIGVLEKDVVTAKYKKRELYDKIVEVCCAGICV
jgi:cell division protein FtsB